MSRPRTIFEPDPKPQNSPLGSQKKPLISRPKKTLSYYPNPMKAQFLPWFNVNVSQPQLNSISTQFQLNIDSTSASISTSTITLAQYGCDIKASQSCLIYYWRTSLILTPPGPISILDLLDPIFFLPSNPWYMMLHFTLTSRPGCSLKK